MVHQRSSRRRDLFIRAKPTRKVAPSTKRYVKSQISRRSETKSFFAIRADAVTTATMVFADLSAIAQGDTNETRVGDKVDLKSLSVGISLRSSTATQLNGVRIFIVSTRVEGTPVASELLRDIGVPESMISRYTDAPMTQKVLFDKYVNLTTPVGAELKTVKFNIFLRKHLGDLHFESAAATTAPNHKLWIGVQSESASAFPLFGFRSVLKYKDG